MAFESALLHHFIQDALTGYSQNFRFADRSNPVEILLNDSRYSVHVSYVHDSGNSRPNDDETRIQMSRAHIDLQSERQRNGTRVAFVGFIESGQYFTAWDPSYILALQAETIVSAYARISMVKRAIREGGAGRKFRSTVSGMTFFTIALPATALGFYLENIQAFHGLADESELRSVLETYGDALATEEGAVVETAAPEQRQKFTYQRTSYPRDPKFASAVLDAYGNQCCICGKQLSIVQAAHIVPHAVTEAMDTVQNGLALCIEHHRLYDDALLLPAPNGKLVVNEERARYLIETNRSNGLDAVREQAKGGFRLPDNPEDHPSEEYLRRGLEIRLGK